MALPVTTRGRHERDCLRAYGGVQGRALIMYRNLEAVSMKYVGERAAGICMAKDQNGGHAP